MKKTLMWGFLLGSTFGLPANAQSELVLGSHVAKPIDVIEYNYPATRHERMPFFLQFSAGGVYPLVEIVRNGDVKFHNYAVPDLSIWRTTFKAGPFLGYAVIKLDGLEVVIPMYQFAGY